MKTLLLSLIFLLCAIPVEAQNATHQNRVDIFMKQLNENQFDAIYDSFTVQFQKKRSRKYVHKVLSEVRRDLGKLQKMELLRYRENKQGSSNANYLGNFEGGNLNIRISVNPNGEIAGLLLKKTPSS